MRSLSRLCCALGAPLILLSVPAGFVARADSTRLPATLYPGHARVTYFPAPSNARVDCLWGFRCVLENTLPVAPLFHLLSQDALGRVGGWGQEATWDRGSEAVVFALFASRYASGLNADDVPRAAAAFEDLRRAAQAQGYVDLPPVARLVTVGTAGGALAMELHGPVFDAILLACWTGTWDIEAVTLYDHGSAGERRMVLPDLVRQVRAATSFGRPVSVGGI